MTDTILTQRGQAMDLRVTWFQAASGGPVLDLTGVAVIVRESNREALSGATITIVDADSGVTAISLTEAEVLGLGDGRTNWFRLEAQWPDGANRVTPKIWVNVQ